MNDLRTYLDEVDARTAAATARLNAHATYLREGPRTDPPYTFSSVPYQEDLQTVLTGSPALSKALRAVLAVVEEHERREAHNEAVPLSRISDLLPESSAADYRQAITTALSETNEGVKE